MIHLKPVFFVVAILLLFAGCVLLVPLAYILFTQAVIGADAQAFLTTSLMAFGVGAPLAIATRKADFRLVPRQMYLLTVLSWVVIAIVSALPFILSSMQLSIVDAVFEAVSGVTTTGSTILVELHKVPHAILLWRALLQWMGGIGIIVMAVAIMPHLRLVMRPDTSHSLAAASRATQAASTGSANTSASMRVSAPGWASSVQAVTVRRGAISAAIANRRIRLLRHIGHTGQRGLAEFYIKVAPSIRQARSTPTRPARQRARRGSGMPVASGARDAPRNPSCHCLNGECRQP